MRPIDIRAIIDITGLIQGLVLGSILILINRKPKKTSFFLGLFVLAFCLDFVPPLLNYLGLTTEYPRLHFLPLRLSDFLFPLMYLYVQEVSILSVPQKSYWVLKPAGFVNLVVFILFLLPDKFRDIAKQHFNWFVGLKIVSEVFGLIIGFITIRTINRHIKTLKEQYTNITYRTLKWVKVYAIIGIIFTIFVPTLNQFFDDYYYSLIVSLLNGVLLYWVSIRGILQNNVIPLIIDEVEEKTNTKQSILEKDPIKSTPELESLSKRVDELVRLEKIYKRSDLTIIDLSEALEIHPKLVSTVINTTFNQNFNTYINHYRIAEAIEILNGTEAQKFSIDGIGKEVGFKSKSSFYTSFKQFTGTTPSLYVESELK